MRPPGSAAAAPARAENEAGPGGTPGAGQQAGAGNGIRTRDPNLGKVVLYP